MNNLIKYYSLKTAVYFDDVISNDEERIIRAQVPGIGQEELIKARWPGVHPAKAIPARFHFEERLNLAVHQEFVAEHSVQAEQIESQQSRRAALGIEQLVSKHHRDIELGEAGKAESGGFIAGVEVVEEKVCPDQTLVGILRGMIEAVVVIEERAERFIDVAGAGMGGENSGEHVRIVLVVEMSSFEEVAREAIALRRRVPVVQVGGDGWQAKPGLIVRL